MSGGGSVSSGDTKFERKGTATTTSFRDLSGKHEERFRVGLNATAPGAADDSVGPMLKNRIRGDTDDRPYTEAICNLIRSNMPQQRTPMEANMMQQAGRDVYSQDYADNTFQRYSAEVQNAMANARSGPAMTRGGTAAQGFAQAQVMNDLGLNREAVLTQNRNADAQISQGATGMIGQNRHMMNADATGAINQGYQGYGQFLQNMMAAAGLASERTKMYNDLVPTFATLESKMIGTEENDLHGRGAQTSSSMGGGINVCCFIMMEGFLGEMPPHVRACRDEFAPESSARRNGYIRMSRWLVPAMRTSGFVRKLVHHLLIAPLTRWGAWHMKVPGGSRRCLDALAKNAWFKFWELTGK